MKMRRGTFWLAIGLLLGAHGQAVAQDVAVGVRGGLAVTDLSIDEDGTAAESDTRSGFVGGVFAQIGLGDIFALRPEGLLVSKGAKGSEGGIETELELSYVEVPVLLVARIPTSGSIRPLLFAGPTIAFETSCEVEAGDGTTEVEGDCADFDEEDPVETKGTDVGLTFGAGLEIDTGRLLWLLDGRYTLGLTDINDTPNAPESVKNRAWSFLAGVGIKIG